MEERKVDGAGKAVMTGTGPHWVRTGATQSPGGGIFDHSVPKEDDRCGDHLGVEGLPEN